MKKHQYGHMDHYVGTTQLKQEALVLVKPVKIEYTYRPPALEGLPPVARFKRPQTFEQWQQLKIIETEIEMTKTSELIPVYQPGEVEWSRWRGIDQVDFMPHLGAVPVSSTTVTVEIFDSESEQTHSGANFGGIAFGD